MKVTATHNVNVDGIWYKAGDTYEVETAEDVPVSAEVSADEASEEDEKPEIKAESKEKPVQNTPKRGRTRKA